MGYIFGAFILLWATKRISEIGLSNKGLILIDALLKAKFGRITEQLFCGLTIILFIGVLAGQFVALASIGKAFLMQNYGPMVLVLAGLGTAAYSVTYGMRAVLANDKIQAFFEIGVAFIVTGSMIFFLSGKSFSLDLTNQGVGGKFGLVYPVIGTLFLMLSMLARGDVWQRLQLVKEESRPKVVWIVVCGLVAYFFAMTTIGKIIASNHHLFPFIPETPGSALMPLIINNVIPHPAFQVLCLAGILIALLSTIDSYLGLVGIMFSSLVTSSVSQWEQTANIEQENAIISNTRISIGIIFFASALLALLIPNLVDLISSSFGLISVMAPCIFIALITKEKLPDYVGWVPLAISMSILVVLLPILKKGAFVPAFIIGVTVCLVMYWLAIKSSTKTQKNSVP